MNSHRRVMQQLSSARPEQLDGESAVRIDDIVALPRFTPRRRPIGRLVLAGAAALAVLGVVLSVPTRESARGQVEAALTAEQLLLAAAEKTVLTAPDSGRYWVVKSEHGSAFTAGPKSDPYRVVQRSYMEQWTKAGTNELACDVGHSLGAKVLDEAAWRRDGSPDSWVRPGDNKSTASTVLLAPGTPQVLCRDGWVMLTSLGGQDLTLAQIRALPEDPDALRAWLLKSYREHPDPDAGTQNERLLHDGGRLLMQLPGVTARQRAAAYRMMAKVTGVRSLGQVTDQKGRPGYAIAWDENVPDRPFEQHLIFSLETGEVLALESHEARKNGKLLGYFAYVSLGWTDDEPPQPTK